MWYSSKADDEKAQPAAIEQRRELVLALHRAEQAEARAAELSTPEHTEAFTLEMDERDRLKCPWCPKAYKFQKGLMTHLSRDHQKPDAAAKVEHAVIELAAQRKGEP